jgi:RNA polymerase sigma-70 factor, ECF subfamily
VAMALAASGIWPVPDTETTRPGVNMPLGRGGSAVHRRRVAAERIMMYALGLTPVRDTARLVAVHMSCEAGVKTADQFKADMLTLLPQLRRFALSLTRSRADADDLVQEACASALAKSQQYDAAQPMDRWMFRIIRNLWIDEMRKRKVRLGEGQIPAEEATELRDNSEAEDAILASQVRGQVAALPAGLSQPLLLVCAEGYSYREAADLLAIPIGTVMSRIHRARQILMAGLDDKERVPQ